jgi:hypothetical protein
VSFRDGVAVSPELGVSAGSELAAG